MFEYEETSINKKFYHFICKECGTVPILQIVEEFKYNIICGNPSKKKNHNLSNIDIKYLKENFIAECEKMEENEIFLCLDHYKQYKDYCQTCNKTVCEDCNCTHPKQNLDNRNIEESINFLLSLFLPDLKGKNEEIPIDSDDYKNSNDNESILKFIISVIINDYHRGKNENLNTCIINLFYFYVKNQLPTINSPNNLKNIKNEDLKKIKKIDIYQYCFDLIILEKSFINLKELFLINNNIDDLQFLIKGEFPNLDKLYLDNNKINDQALNKMNKFKCKNIKEFSLKQNYISDYKIFVDVSKNFKLLEKLNLSSNKFKNVDFFNTIKEKIKLDYIKELILSNGVFDQKSVNNISKISLKQLNRIDLSCNNLENLKFIKDIEWPEIKEIILNDNDITDIKELQKFKKEKIELFVNIDNNLIDSEDKINEIICDHIKIKYQLCSELNEIEHNNNLNLFRDNIIIYY